MNSSTPVLAVAALALSFASSAGAAPAPLGTFGSTGSDPGQFRTPFGLAEDQGLLYVADYGNSRARPIGAREHAARAVEHDREVAAERLASLLEQIADRSRVGLGHVGDEAGVARHDARDQAQLFLALPLEALLRRLTRVERAQHGLVRHLARAAR